MDKFFPVLISCFILTFSLCAVVCYQTRLENKELQKQILILKKDLYNSKNIISESFEAVGHDFKRMDYNFNELDNKINKNNEQIDIIKASIDPDNFRWVKIKKVREAVRDTVKDFNYNRYLNTKQLTEYAVSVVDYSDKYDVPISLILAMTRKESGFNPRALSHADAKGMIQIIPDTAKQISLELNQKYYNMYKISDNVKFSVYYIMTLMDMYDRNLDLVLRGYNCGPTCVHHVESGIFSAYPEETKNYVRMILTDCISYSEEGICKLKGFKKYYEDMGL